MPVGTSLATIPRPAATCFSEHEIDDSNCDGNIYLDSGPSTISHLDHLTKHRALAADSREPGAGVRIDRNSIERESYSFSNSLFESNAPNKDFAAACDAEYSTIDQPQIRASRRSTRPGNAVPPTLLRSEFG